MIFQRLRSLRIILLFLLVDALSHQVHAVQGNSQSSIIEFAKDYPLPGKTTRWDYMSLDSQRSQLFIAHLGDSALVVVDTKTKTVRATIDNIGSVHGVLVVPELNRVYASATKTNEVVVIDATSLSIVARVATGTYPDGMAYAPEVHKLYVSNEYGKSETAIDALSNKYLATIELKGNVGNSQYDSVSKHIFVNVQSSEELVEIDPNTDIPVQRIKLAGADSNHGLLIDASHRLAFIACEGNDKLLILNLDTRKITGSFNLGKAPDVLAYDAKSGWLYVASESGIVSIFNVNPDGGVTKAGDSFVGANAHTLAIDPSSHEIYFPLNINGQAVLRVFHSAP